MAPVRLFCRRRLHVVQRDGERDAGVDHRLVGRLAVQQHGITAHVMPDVAHQHQASTGKRQFPTLRIGITPVFVQSPREFLAALGDDGLEATVHQAQPVAVHANLVGGIDRCDRILAVLDGRQRRLDQQVGDAGGVKAADAVTAVNRDLDVQAVIAQQNGRGQGRCAAPAGIAGGNGQARVRAIGKSHRELAIADRITR